MKWTPLLMFTALSFLMTSTVLGQQAYVSRYDAFAGYTFLNDGADVDDRARPTLDECRCRGVRQPREGDAVECNYLFHFVDVSIEKRHDGADTSVVDEHCDTRIFLQLCFHFREIYLVVEVRHDRSDVASARAGEARSERFEGRLAAGYENEIVSTLRETVCIDSPDAPRSTRYQGGAF